MGFQREIWFKGETINGTTCRKKLEWLYSTAWAQGYYRAYIFTDRLVDKDWEIYQSLKVPNYKLDYTNRSIHICLDDIHKDWGTTDKIFTGLGLDKINWEPE